jgi:hypothetical protein
MRILLKMFTGDWEMSSKEINVPENTGGEFVIQLPTPVQIPILPWSKIYDECEPQYLVRCTFLYTGRKTENGTRIYRLNDIKGGK